MEKFLDKAEAYRRFSNTGGLSVINVGYNDFKFLKPNTIPWMQKHYTLHFVLSGSGVLRINGEEHRLRMGDLFLIAPHIEIFYAPSEEEWWEYVWFSFNGEDAAEISQNLGFENASSAQVGNYGKIRHVFEKIFESADQSSGYYGVLSAFYELLEIITSKPRDTGIATIKKMIDDNFAMCDFNITQLVHESHLSHSHLIRLFKGAYGTTPVKYLTERRIRYAKELLLTTELPVKSVALSCGYSDEIHFMKVFKKFTSMSALEYRRNQRISV